MKAVEKQHTRNIFMDVVNENFEQNNETQT